MTVATLTEAAKILGIPRITLYRWLREGFITGEQIIPGAPWRIRMDQALRDIRSRIYPGSNVASPTRRGDVAEHDAPKKGNGHRSLRSGA
jgi:excisionase family DNA binding protein